MFIESEQRETEILGKEVIVNRSNTGSEMGHPASTWTPHPAVPEFSVLQTDVFDQGQVK